MNQKQYRVNSLANFSLPFLLLLCVWLAPSFSRFHNCFRTLWIRSWIQRWGVIIGFAANMLSCVALTVQSCPQGYTHCALYTGSMHLEKGIYTRTLYRMYICVCVYVSEGLKGAKVKGPYKGVIITGYLKYWMLCVWVLAFVYAWRRQRSMCFTLGPLDPSSQFPSLFCSLSVSLTHTLLQIFY